MRAILRTLDAHRGEYLCGLVRGEPGVPTAAQQFASVQEIDFAEPNILHYINDIPNDSFSTPRTTANRRNYSVGISNGIGIASNLNAEAAWNITSGQFKHHHCRD